MKSMTYSKNIIDNIFGGIRPASRALDKAATTVQGWYDSGTIPQKHWAGIISAAKAFNHSLSSEDFFPKQLQNLGHSVTLLLKFTASLGDFTDQILKHFYRSANIISTSIFKKIQITEY